MQMKPLISTKTKPFRLFKDGKYRDYSEQLYGQAPPDGFCGNDEKLSFVNQTLRNTKPFRVFGIKKINTAVNGFTVGVCPFGADFCRIRSGFREHGRVSCRF